MGDSTPGFPLKFYSVVVRFFVEGQGGLPMAVPLLVPAFSPEEALIMGEQMFKRFYYDLATNTWRSPSLGVAIVPWMQHVMEIPPPYSDMLHLDMAEHLRAQGHGRTPRPETEGQGNVVELFRRDGGGETPPNDPPGPAEDP